MYVTYNKTYFFIDLKYLFNVAEYHIRFGRKMSGKGHSSCNQSNDVLVVDLYLWLTPNPIPMAVF